MASQSGTFTGSVSRKANRAGRSEGVRKMKDDDNLQKVTTRG